MFSIDSRIRCTLLGTGQRRHLRDQLRPDHCHDPVTLEAFKYLGAGTLIERSRPEVNVTLSMVSQSGGTGDAGDQYTGLDRFGRVVDQRWITGSGSTATEVDRYGYTYDRNGNRLTRSNALASAFSETYSYDALNQLQGFARGSTSSPSTTQDWEFDALGNWRTVTTDGVDQTRTANAQNELTQVGRAALAYSTTGNLTTDAQGRTLAYDAWNRLVSVYDVSSTQVARYEYDGMNRRIVEQAGTLASPAAASAAVRDLFYTLQWQVLEERVRNGAGAIPATADTRYVWSPVYVDAMIARDRNADGNASTGTGGLDERVYALQDANWNTTAIVAASGVTGFGTGDVINRFAYTPYGESQALTAAWTAAPAGTAIPWSHLFQGLKLTEITNLFYVRNRDYSASLGRFIERDPIGFAAGDNNWYRFVGNGPTGNTDPSGLLELPVIITGPPYGWEPRTGPPYSHAQWLGREELWTYSKHTISFTVNTRDPKDTVLGQAFNMLRRFSYFESTLANVRLITPDRTMARFDLRGLGGVLSDLPFMNDDEVQVRLEKTGNYELTGTTAGAHQIIGYRKWRVMLDDEHAVCGQRRIVMETEADEKTNGHLNWLGSISPMGRTAQTQIWAGHLERTAKGLPVF